MRWMIAIALLLFAAGCDKTVHEARTPINWNAFSATAHQALPEN